MSELSIKTYNLKKHNIYLKGDVDEDMWSDLVNKINDIKEDDNEVYEYNGGVLSLLGLKNKIEFPQINIYLSTFGGYIYDTISIYDEIKKLQNEYVVNIYCVGKVMSAGTIIMLSVDFEHRFAYPNTTFMYHTLSSENYGKMKDMEENVEENKRLHELMWKIYKENTKIPQEKLDEIYKCKKDWFITAKEALEYKIISEII